MTSSFRSREPKIMYKSGACLAWDNSLSLSEWRQTPKTMERHSATAQPLSIMTFLSSIMITFAYGLVAKQGKNSKFNAFQW